MTPFEYNNFNSARQDKSQGSKLHDDFIFHFLTMEAHGYHRNKEGFPCAYTCKAKLPDFHSV